MNENTSLGLGVYNVSRGLSAMEESQSTRCKAALSALLKNAQSIGLKDGEILLALGEGRDMLDPFGMFTAFWGRMMKYLGTPFAVALSLLSILALVDWLVDKVDDVGRWIGKLFAGIPGMFFWSGVKNSAGLNDADSVYDMSGPIQKIAGAGLRGFVYGLLPPPIAGAIAAGLAALTGFGSAMASSPVSTAAGGAIGTAIGLGGGSALGSLGRGALKVGRGALKVGKGGFNLVKKLGGWLLKDEVPDAFSDEEIQDLADALDAQPEEVRVLLQGGMDADENDDED